ncbi:hypothetical protein ANANG_G00298440 [Anguilla anguilla]|uniref:Uncharacterized protein n=1 Tax=Anguilla anguilla TaxID=7936 RepID=A0A9D3LMB1_ANGAN|nr:hypothetical protein ANANG_G00298440 [Anguilla anguilla]
MKVTRGNGTSENNIHTHSSVSPSTARIPQHKQGIPTAAKATGSISTNRGSLLQLKPQVLSAQTGDPYCS